VVAVARTRKGALAPLAAPTSDQYDLVGVPATGFKFIALTNLKVELRKVNHGSTMTGKLAPIV